MLQVNTNSLIELINIIDTDTFSYYQIITKVGDGISTALCSMINGDKIYVICDDHESATILSSIVVNPSQEIHYITKKQLYNDLDILDDPNNIVLYHLMSSISLYDSFILRMYQIIRSKIILITTDDIRKIVKLAIPTAKYNNDRSVNLIFCEEDQNNFIKLKNSVYSSLVDSLSYDENYYDIIIYTATLAESLDIQDILENIQDFDKKVITIGDPDDTIQQQMDVMYSDVRDFPLIIITHSMYKISISLDNISVFYDTGNRVIYHSNNTGLTSSIGKVDINTLSSRLGSYNNNTYYICMDRDQLIEDIDEQHYTNISFDNLLSYVSTFIGHNNIGFEDELNSLKHYEILDDDMRLTEFGIFNNDFNNNYDIGINLTKFIFIYYIIERNDNNILGMITSLTINLNTLFATPNRNANESKSDYILRLLKFSKANYSIFMGKNQIETMMNIWNSLINRESTLLIWCKEQKMIFDIASKLLSIYNNLKDIIEIESDEYIIDDNVWSLLKEVFKNNVYYLTNINSYIGSHNNLLFLEDIRFPFYGLSNYNKIISLKDRTVINNVVVCELFIPLL